MLKPNVMTIKELRKQFPLLSKKINGQPIVFFDNAATTQKPQSVIKAITEFYTIWNCNIHRASYKLSMDASQLYDDARITIAKAINAEPEEIVFTSGVTESINLAALMVQKLYGNYFKPLVSELDHHSNILPYISTNPTNVPFNYIPVDDNGDLDIEQYEQLLIDNKSFNSNNISLIAVSHVSNAIGTVNPINYIVQKAHENNIPVLIDAAQSYTHRKIDVKAIGCDFMAFSGHKSYAPTGIGVLYISKKFANDLVPVKIGGGMAESVTWNKVVLKEAPERFEAGTPNIEGAIGMMVAANFVEKIGIDVIEKYEKELTNYAVTKLSQIKKVKIIGNPKERSCIISFAVDGIKNIAVGTKLNEYNICSRIGFHCTHPLMQRLELTDGTIRVSFAMYNTKEEVDFLVKVLSTF